MTESDELKPSAHWFDSRTGLTIMTTTWYFFDDAAGEHVMAATGGFANATVDRISVEFAGGSYSHTPSTGAFVCLGGSTMRLLPSGQGISLDWVDVPG